MQISLREFEVFLATMELGTLTAAADALGMSQPAASKLLKNTEIRMGLTLFRRHKKKLIPTPEAYQLYPGLVHALSSMEDVKRTADNLRKGHSGQMLVVTNPAVAANALPEALQMFNERFPGLALAVRTRTTVEISELIANERADIGVIYEAASDPRLAVETLKEIEIGCLMRPDHPLAALEGVTIADLADHTLIALGKTQPVGVALRRAMQEAGKDIPVAVEVSQSNTACSFVQAGFGVAVLDGLGLKEGKMRGLVARPLTPRSAVRISIVRSINRQGSRFLDELSDCIRKAVRSID